MSLDDIARFEQRLFDSEGGIVQEASGEVRPLKYGEAMGNKAAEVVVHDAFELVNSERALGQVNHLDILAAARLMLSTGGTVIVKHTSPCGAAYGFDDVAEEYRLASAVDEVARFGGIISVPRVTPASAEQMVGKSGRKLQAAVAALAYDDGAIDTLLAAKNPPLVFRLNDKHFDISGVDVQEGLYGPVLQERIPGVRPDELVQVAGGELSAKTIDDVIFGQKVADAKHSNAVVFVEPYEQGAVAVGIGGGTADRISAANQAMENAVKFYFAKYVKVPRAEIPDEINVELIMASDGFFPDAGALSVASPDEVKGVKKRLANYPQVTMQARYLGSKTQELLASESWSVQDKYNFIGKRLNISVPVVLNPGGSKGDNKAVEYALEKGMAMVMAKREGSHLRGFKHSPQSVYRTS